ncbi:response regulator [Rhodopseudomonas sp. P2A-2r]|uniref:response regulator n=1 Tax=unclassified Rhodopseudomonas TaxID=2638247 RepID=UPI002234513E|nr:response regulator [Rhodopseudomonas sp. P2A-2r]UZE49008.1 response regulator [Rhodopseudomonas sp. P2A-2r]
MAAVLVVEDVPAVLLSLKIVLEGQGHNVTSALDGEQGLKLLTDTPFDLVITDIWMPVSNGTDVIREGRARSPGTRFLAITGGDPNGCGSRERLPEQDFGADQVLLKPFEKQELLNAVSSILQRAV